jgi:hypothetical protein
MWRFISGKRTARTCQMEQRAIGRFVIVKGLKVKEIEMKLIGVHGNEAFQISAIKKCRMLSARANRGQR